MKLVTLSGIDGSGKTSVSERLAAALSARGIAARSIRPDYICNDVVKAFCADRFGDPYAYVPNLDPTFYISVLLADWFDLARKTLVHAGGQILICDRYLSDVLAQALHYRADIDVVLRTIALFPVPHVPVCLDISPLRAHARLRQRAEPALHHLESEANLELLADAYEHAWSLLGWMPIRIDADIAVETLIEQLVELVIARVPVEPV